MAAPSGTVTFLFTDIEGSVKLWESHPAEMQAALARHDEILREVMQSADGHVFKTIGDAFCVAFDTSPNALQASVRAQEALIKEKWPGGIKIRSRMAIHTGSADPRDGDYFGQTLNRTSRLLVIGHGGQILMSDVAQDLARDSLPKGISFKPLGAHRLRDLGRPEFVFQVESLGLGSEFPALRSLDSLPNNLPQQLTSFIGREEVLADLKALIGRTRLLTLTGSGGSGKTRLSLQVAADLLDGSGDGVWFVDLASLRDPALVAATIA